MTDKEKIAQIIAEHLCSQGKSHKRLYGSERMCYSRNNFAECEKVSECVDALIAAGIGDTTNLKAENAELRARLEKAVELPCKIGDIVYQTDTDGLRILESIVKNIIFETSSIAFDEQAIGESIFLTEEAVKEKMKKLQEKNND